MDQHQIENLIAQRDDAIARMEAMVVKHYEEKAALDEKIEAVQKAQAEHVAMLNEKHAKEIADLQAGMAADRQRLDDKYNYDTVATHTAILELRNELAAANNTIEVLGGTEVAKKMAADKQRADLQKKIADAQAQLAELS